MDYMHKDEKKWAKENGLKKTKFKYCGRIIYESNDGRFFYRDHNIYKNIPRETIIH